MSTSARASGGQGKLSVIVTGVGSTTGMSVIKALRNQDSIPVRIVGVDTHQPNEIAGSFFCDDFVQVPRADHTDYVRAMLEVCRRERPTMLVPIIDPEVEVISSAVQEFRKLCALVAVGDFEMVRACNDKRATRELLAAGGFPVPKAWPAESLDPQQLSYPVFVKPRRGVSSRGARRVDSAEVLTSLLMHTTGLEVEEYLEGIEFTIDVLADLDGQLMAVVPRERLEVRAGISYKGRTADRPDLISAAMSIAGFLRLRGPANLQCIVRAGRAVFIEINPRFSGSLPLTVAAGVNGPLWLLRRASGEPAPQGLLPFRSGVVMTRYWSELFHTPECS